MLDPGVHDPERCGRPVSPRVAILCGDDPISRIVCHAVAGRFTVAGTVVEDRPSRLKLIRRRVHKLGVGKVAGQLLFMGVVVPTLRRRSAARVAAICKQHSLDVEPIGGGVVRVPTVNSPEARAALAAMRPDVVVVNGTRVIDPETLASVPVPILNMHAGITPLYRGVHGGYWALAEGRNDLVGTTVHLVSPGIDTGRVVGQATFEITPEDDFTTYPFLHVAHGLPLLLDAIADASAGRLSSRKNPLGLSSMLRSHPTAWSYLKGRARLGVR